MQEYHFFCLLCSCDAQKFRCHLPKHWNSPSFRSLYSLTTFENSWIPRVYILKPWEKNWRNDIIESQTSTIDCRNLNKLSRNGSTVTTDCRSIGCEYKSRCMIGLPSELWYSDAKIVIYALMSNLLWYVLGIICVWNMTFYYFAWIHIPGCVWKQYPNTKTGGTNTFAHGITRVEDCLSACLSQWPACNGVDFVDDPSNLVIKSFCWFSNSMNALESGQGVTHYSLTCPATGNGHWPEIFRLDIEVSKLVGK